MREEKKSMNLRLEYTETDINDMYRKLEGH